MDYNTGTYCLLHDRTKCIEGLRNFESERRNNMDKVVNNGAVATNVVIIVNCIFPLMLHGVGELLTGLIVGMICSVMSLKRVYVMYVCRFCRCVLLCSTFCAITRKSAQLSKE